MYRHLVFVKTSKALTICDNALENFEEMIYERHRIQPFRGLDRCLERGCFWSSDMLVYVTVWGGSAVSLSLTLVDCFDPEYIDAYEVVPVTGVGYASFGDCAYDEEEPEVYSFDRVDTSLVYPFEVVSERGLRMGLFGFDDEEAKTRAEVPLKRMFRDAEAQWHGGLSWSVAFRDGRDPQAICDRHRRDLERLGVKKVLIAGIGAECYGHHQAPGATRLSDWIDRAMKPKSVNAPLQVQPSRPVVVEMRRRFHPAR